MDQTLCLRGANFKVHWTLTEARAPAPRHVGGHAGPAAPTRAPSTACATDGGGTRFEYENEFKAPGRPARRGGQPGDGGRRARARGARSLQHSKRCSNADAAMRHFARVSSEGQIHVCATRSLSSTRSHTQMADFLDEKRKEIQARLKELKPPVEEYQLPRGRRRGAQRDRQRRRAQPPPPPAPHARAAARRRAPAPAGSDRPPRAARAAAAPAPPRRSSSSAAARASPSPSWPRRWASSRTTSTASCPASPRRAR